MFELLISSRPPGPSWRVLIRVAVLAGAVCPLAAQTEYTADGTPTPVEEEIRWLMNRGRFDSAQENVTRGTSYTGLATNAPPLAPNHALTLASRHHSEDMARLGVFQHETIPGSSYYDATNQPLPWDRMRAEGYSWNSAAENIAAGRSTAEATYTAWWNSGGHRANMYNANLREVGNGYFYWNDSTYRHYYTMDLGRSASTHFFTGTVFHDTNGDGTYDQGEGIAGIRLRLRIGGVIHSSFDVSSAAGSFAVPIDSILDGATVEVLAANPTAGGVTISLPRDYARHDTLTLGVGEEIVAGTFTQPTGALNVGFRNLAPAPPAVTAPLLALTGSGGNLELRWNSQLGVLYEPQSSTNLIRWTDLVESPLVGTGAEMTVASGLAPAGTPFRFYRMLARSP